MVLGIVISVTAIVLVQTVGNNVKSKFHSYINKTYPANTVYLAAGNGFMGGGKGSDNLRQGDIDAVVNSVSGIVGYDPVVYAGSENISSFGNSSRASVEGLSELAEQARNREVIEGRFISKEEVRKKSQVAVIGSTVANELFPQESPLGKTLFYKNMSFEIIGLLESVGADPHGGDADNVVQVPYTTLMAKILKRDYFSGATFILQDYDSDSVAQFALEVSQVMRDRHQISDSTNDDFSLMAANFMLELVGSVFKKFDIIVPILSVVVFLISGVVILNIMLAIIRERVPEIGLRMALGARSEDIRLQIFIEMLVICTIGAVVGVLVSNFILLLLQPIFAEKFGIEHLEFSPIVNVVAVVMALICGVLSAMVPAQRAAKLNPVAALA
jgi:putative ABC transport system permease protein